jgi:predicted TIM-barrel fold metal-dependent hydrolase
VFAPADITAAATQPATEEGNEVQADDLILISVDDHVVEPPDMFDGRVPDRYRDRAPRVVHKDDGTDVWSYEGNEIPNVGLNAVVGRPPEEYGIEPTSFAEMRPGCYDVDERIRDMNVNGVLGSMCFPSFVQFCGQLFARTEDKDMAIALLRAYNDWHIESWCGTHPGRFIPLSIPPIWDPELMADEVRRVGVKGCHAVTFSENPSKLGWPSFHSEHWDPFWSACADEGTVVCLHIGSSSTLAITAPDAPFDVLIALQPVNIIQCAADLLFSPVLRKYPDLRIALSEGGIGWIPYFLERVDYVYSHHRAWTGQDFGDQLPSQVFSERIITCFIDDAFGVESRRHLELDNVCWECDYPHSDSTWPQAPEMAMKYLDGVSDAEVAKITHENATRLFRFDPFAHRPREQCTVAALRAEATDVDTSLTPRKAGAARKPTFASDLAALSERGS